MSELRLPEDVPAERVVVGCAIDSPQAARFAAVLDPADFTVATHRRLWRASLNCPLPFKCDGSRTRAIAVSAGVPFEVAEEIRQAMPVLDDRTRYWAGRVREATLRRRLMAQVAEVHDALGAGALLDDAKGRIEYCLQVAAGDAIGLLAGAEAVARGSRAVRPGVYPTSPTTVSTRSPLWSTSQW